MGIHERIEKDDADRLPQRFVAMCAETWGKYGQSRELLAGAMLAHAINMMIEDGESDEVAHILAGLAFHLSTPEARGGHA